MACNAMALMFAWVRQPLVRNAQVSQEGVISAIVRGRPREGIIAVSGVGRSRENPSPGVSLQLQFPLSVHQQNDNRQNVPSNRDSSPHLKKPGQTHQRRWVADLVSFGLT